LSQPRNLITQWLPYTLYTYSAATYSKPPQTKSLELTPYRGVHIDDVADTHIRALTLANTTPVSSFLLSAKARTWEEVMEFVHEKFPEQGFKTKPKEGDLLIVETARAERELGFEEWKGMEVQVRDVVEQQIELRGDV
jgi:UDP-glucose 4-epimerase